MIEDFWRVLLAIFGGVVTLAIVSVVISKKSQSPQVIQAAATALAAVVAAAVNPANTAATNGNLGLATFGTPGGNVQHTGITISTP